MPEPAPVALMFCGVPARLAEIVRASLEVGPEPIPLTAVNLNVYGVAEFKPGTDADPLVAPLAIGIRAPLKAGAQPDPELISSV